jgi:hypothetical protein
MIIKNRARAKGKTQTEVSVFYERQKAETGSCLADTLVEWGKGIPKDKNEEKTREV